MNILLFGGTTEGRLLARELSANGHDVTVCVATELGAEELAEIPGLTVRTGRLETQQMARLVREFALCIDATHPYAKIASGNIREACRDAGVPLRRALREESPIPDGCMAFASAQETAAFLAGTAGNILLATGAKELEAYAALDASRLYVRVLPTVESIAACERLHIPHSNIIAMQGPFSRELNEAMLKQFHIAYFVTKDGGGPGGFDAKVVAARAAGAQLILIRRTADAGENWADIARDLGRKTT